MSDESIDISMLSNGIYFITIATPTKTATQKFVVAN
ncbi:MAG: T9SS type A sorting domain-containing protein [Bacteroidetes bacterium]|nr:T9SS type A sorting domain-containing protein [Bacteroidota bacterium]